MIDIYFEPNYGKLYEKIEDGICEVFEYNCELGNIYHMFIKREIPLQINNKTYFDLVTPYGYGGPLITECKEGDRKELVLEFEHYFAKYCEENNIISEFVRFHPVVGNALDFKEIYKIENIRKTVGTNIIDYKNPITSEFSKSARKTIRRSMNAGVSFNIIEKPESIHNFKEIYYSTMKRNNASDYYYFDDDYFDECLELFQNHIILVEVLYQEKVIAAGFYFVYGKYIHAHLSGTLKDYLHLSPAYIIKYATAKWAKNNDVHFIHYGGGITNSSDDSLYQFKKKFGKNTDFDFYIGKRIWDKEVYEELCKLKNVDDNIEFFPAYRSEVENNN